MSSPLRSEFDETKSNGGSELPGRNAGPGSPQRRVTSFSSAISFTALPGDKVMNGSDAKEEEHVLGAIWKQVMDPVLTYCEVI